MTLEECIATGLTLDDVNKCCTKSTVDAQFGCINPPLFEIKPEHIVVDEFHLLLRISDRLMSALIMRMCPGALGGMPAGGLVDVQVIGGPEDDAKEASDCDPEPQRKEPDLPGGKEPDLPGGKEPDLPGGKHPSTKRLPAPFKVRDRSPSCSAQVSV